MDPQPHINQNPNQSDPKTPSPIYPVRIQINDSLQQIPSPHITSLPNRNPSPQSLSIMPTLSLSPLSLSFSLNRITFKSILQYLCTILLIFVIALQFTNTDNNQVKYLSILLANGNKVQLPYLNNQLIVPPRVSQQPKMKLNIQNATQVRIYAAGFKSKLDFSSKLFLNWRKNNIQLDKAQYISLNQSYNMDIQIPQRRLCIMSPFRNLLKYGYNGSFHLFLKSLDSQNYSNYMVYMIDDMSTDNSSQILLKQLQKYPYLNNRIRIIINKEQLGALGNRDSTTRNYCHSGDIVMDIDGDDALVGKQVFNLFNRLYWAGNGSAWYVYTNFIAVNGSTTGDGRSINLDMDKAQPGICQKIPDHLHKTNTYRTNPYYWMTSQLRSYLYDLYMKIPIHYLIQRQTGRYYYQASDRFVMYSLAQLAGPNHTFFYPQYSYFYYLPNYRALQKFQCTIPTLFYCQAQARILTPLNPLKNINDTVTVPKFYAIPSNMLAYYIQKQQNYYVCQERLKGIDKIFQR